MYNMICFLAGEEIEIPDKLLETESSFRSALNLEVFQSLEKEEQEKLKKLLPDFGAEERTENADVLQETLGDEKFKHGNPVHIIYDKIKNGLLTPEAVQISQDNKRLKYKMYKLSQKEYYNNLLEEIVCARQKILSKSFANNCTSQFKSDPEFLEVQTKSYPSVDRVNKRYKKILKDISHECGDKNISSDEEIEDCNSSHSENKIKSTKNLDLLPEKQYRKLLNLHKRRKVFAKKNPELLTTNIKLIDVINRCNISKKVVKQKSIKLKKKVTPAPPANNNQQNVALPKIKPPTNQSPVKSPIIKKKESTSKKSAKDYPTFSSFFGLIGYLFSLETDKKCTLTKIKDEVKQWQKIKTPFCRQVVACTAQNMQTVKSHKSSENCTWKMFYPDWVPLVSYAMDYMCGKGTSSSLKDFIPLIAWSEDDNKWLWKETSYKSDVISPFFDHWQETLSNVMVKVRDVKQTSNLEKKAIDTARTNFVVAETSKEFKKEFRRQESERYKNPFNAFIYNTHGYQSVVGPVKGIFSARDISAGRAREHAMLVPDRPSYVTILCLVRDAVARLPNGEGTRGDVAILLKDSQYVNAEANSQQINNLVSGALDRLHAEKDPCVKFDPTRKVWLYLHRSRSLDEFEKLHQASGAAALAKRQLALSKQKAAAKQKKMALEIKELTENQNNENKVEAKPIMEPNTSLININTSNTVPLKDSAVVTKKKLPKRKKTPTENNESTIKTKVAKVDSSKPFSDYSDTVSHSMENEALMATQSILNDADDIFGSQSSDADFLNIDSFSPGLSFETNLNNDLSDFDKSLFSGEKLSKDISNTGSMRAPNKGPATDNPMHLSLTTTRASLSSTITTSVNQSLKKSLPQLSDILSDKANSILRPPTVKSKSNISSASSNSANSVMSGNSQNTHAIRNPMRDSSKLLLQSKNISKPQPVTSLYLTTSKAFESMQSVMKMPQSMDVLKQQNYPARMSGLTKVHTSSIQTSKHSTQLKYHPFATPNKEKKPSLPSVAGNVHSIPITNVAKATQMMSSQMMSSKTVSPRLTVQSKGALQNLSQFITTRLPSAQISKGSLQENTGKTIPIGNVQRSSIHSTNTMNVSRPLVSQSGASHYQLVNIKSPTGSQVITALPANTKLSGSTIRVPFTQTTNLTSIQSLLQAANKGGAAIPQRLPVQNIPLEALRNSGRTIENFRLPQNFTGGKTQFVAKIDPANTKFLNQASAAKFSTVHLPKVGVSAPVKITLPQQKSTVTSSSLPSGENKQTHFSLTSTQGSLSQIDAQNLVFPRAKPGQVQSTYYPPVTTSSNKY